MESLAGNLCRSASLVIAALLAGCGARTDVLVDTEDTSSVATYGWRAAIVGEPGVERPKPLVGAITLRRAVNAVVTFSPSVKSASAEIDAMKGEAYQASRRLNPEIAGAVGSLPNSGGIAAEDASTEIRLAQTFELGGKRIARLRAANLGTSVADWGYEVARLQAATEAVRVFVDVVAAQERAQILRDSVGIAQKTRAAVEERVNGGQASPIELDRAQVSVADTKAALAAENTRLRATRDQLAALWGEDRASFQRAVGRLGADRRVPTLGQIRALLDANPSLARWTDTIGYRSAILDVERSKAIPNLTVGAGVSRFASDGSTGMLAEVSIPLPVFDRNDGAISAAHQRVAKAQFDAQAARSQLTVALIGALGALSAADVEASAIEQQVLPAAEAAFRRTRTGYDEGRFDLLDVFDTQRVLFEARQDLINARANYERARVRVEALIGTDLTTLTQ
jgi:cobalt-zinc-cadmium efflux system outer membrane protein